jgi:hypothetical protein
MSSRTGAFSHSGSSHWSDWHHHHRHFHHHHSFFFLSIGSPFYSPFFYDPFFYGYGPYYPGFGFSYVGSHFGFSYASPAYVAPVYPWPIYSYDAYGPVVYADPPVAAAPPYAAGRAALDPAGFDAPVRSDAEFRNAAGVSADAPIGPKVLKVGPAKVEPGAEAAAGNFAREGEDAFKARDYKSAVRSWRHALLDDPNNATLVMLLAQGLFAAGEYDESAGAAQAAMRMLPQDKWGVVVGNYTELYSNTQDYVDQLKTLEKAVKDDPKDPARRFLVGFHYGYLGYPADAVRELDKLVEMNPKDELGRKLRDLMAEEAKKKGPPKSDTPTPEAKPE